MGKFLLKLKVPLFHCLRSHSQNTVERFRFNTQLFFECLTMFHLTPSPSLVHLFLQNSKKLMPKLLVVPPRLLKNVASSIALPLASIFELFLQNSFLSQIWKQSYVTPILKNKDSSSVTNYRLISLTWKVMSWSWITFSMQGDGKRDPWPTHDLFAWP